MATRSGRTLGSGRVLGATKPTHPQSPTTPVPSHLRRESSLPTSPSATSLNSQTSSNEETDIGTAVRLSARENVPSVNGDSTIVCPICNEQMVTLLQLNRHLDDDHRNVEEQELDEVKTWFKSQVVKAKRFQPLAVLNQKLKGLDVFESNDDRPSVVTPVHSRTASADVSQSRPVASEEPITREHWQRFAPDGCCSDPLCESRLGGMNGNINCRKCGKLFCEEHTMYQMKLSRAAQHEPVRGYWSRVCETCFKSREGYNDHAGSERSHFAEFAKVRRKAVDKSYLEVSRLQKRLTKLTQLLVDPRLEQDQSAVGYLWSLSGAKSQKRLLEETVVDWEDDAKVDRCPFCQQEFTSYTFRRHHCRLCGRVVCADLSTGCSSELAFNVEKNEPEKAKVLPVDIRLCKECKHTVFSKADYDRDISLQPSDQKSFQNLKQFEKGIQMMLPRFQKLLLSLQNPEKPPTPAQLQEATRVRRRLTDSFTQYDIASKRIRDLPTDSKTQEKLQRNIYAQASQFLHVHMLPLKSLPKILKHAAPHGRSLSSESVNGHVASTIHVRSPLASIERNGPPNAEESSQKSSVSRLSSLEAEEKIAREQLIVLEEQKLMIGEMLSDAQRRRKFDDVDSLSRNLDDLTKECDRLQGILHGLKVEVAEVYTGNNS